MENRRVDRRLRDAIRGCLFGGAVGDALGYPVEFLNEREIFGEYGTEGITAYEKDPLARKPVISDDTQMALFTANGLLAWETGLSAAQEKGGVTDPPRQYIARAYRDWLLTQESSIRMVNAAQRGTAKGGSSWLLDVPELYHRRAPGITCLSALGDDTFYDDYVKEKVNQSKGCGGIMRVAPIALDKHIGGIEAVDMEAAQAAAITHGHSLGYMTSAVLVHIINRIVYPPEGTRMTLEEIVCEARDSTAKIFAGDPGLKKLTEVIDLALDLAWKSKKNESTREEDLANIHHLGEGWVAEETLGISLYCALRHRDDFSEAMIVSVNHRGDSDSTGAVTGNILGALLGYAAIDEKWKTELELADVILEMADDLYLAARAQGKEPFHTRAWKKKYVEMRRYEK